MYIHISCICWNNTANHLKCGQQLLGLTPRVNPLLWNWAQQVSSIVKTLIGSAIYHMIHGIYQIVT